MKLKKGMRGKNNGIIHLVNDLPDDIIMAEVGCYAGESALFFLKSGKINRFYAIDPWKDKLEGDVEGTEEFKQRTKYVYDNMEWAEKSFDIRMIPYQEIVIKLKMTLLEADAYNRLPILDAIYIDGDHRYEGVLNDILLAKKLVKKGGIIAGHDYHWESPGVKQAVDEIFYKPHKIYPDSSWRVDI